MDVVGLPEFSRSMRSVITNASDARQVAELLTRLATDHDSVDMQDEQVQIPGTGIELWATRGLQLSGGEGRVTWRYEERNGYLVIVCFSLVQVDSRLSR
ncbi:MAG: hypothetical protein BMS9Abin20_0907 [Acidimicrobiia bacterium]|nr:MAG: hypothetical protein BMS9Abin20_0907 [Acidimicrobiia bacterium]